MKVKGKQVIDIRPMTRGEYDKKHDDCELITDCAKRFGLTAKCNEQGLYDCYDGDVIFGYDIDGCKECFQQPAKVNGKYIMLVRLKKMSYQRGVCKRAVEEYGEMPQIIMAMEEMSELIQALSKSIRGKTDVDNIAEKIADVEIMLMQMKHIFHCGTAVEDWKTAKVLRLEKNLNERKCKTVFLKNEDAEAKINEVIENG